MIYLLWVMGGLAAWMAFGWCWCRWVAGPDKDDEYQECPYE